MLDAVLQRAKAYAWPGNVRELDHWVERVLAGHEYLAAPEKAVDAQRLREIFPECASSTALRETEAARKSTLKDKAKLAERQHMAQVLESVDGDQSRACEILGISRATLWRRMKG